MKKKKKVQILQIISFITMFVGVMLCFYTFLNGNLWIMAAGIVIFLLGALVLRYAMNQ